MQAFNEIMTGFIFGGAVDDKAAARQFQQNAGPQAAQYLTDTNKMGPIVNRQSAQQWANDTRDNRPLSAYVH